MENALKRYQINNATDKQNAVFYRQYRGHCRLQPCREKFVVKDFIQRHKDDKDANIIYIMSSGFALFLTLKSKK